MKKLTLMLALLLVVSAAFSQELSDKLPNDSKTTIGKMDNGMAYYIRKNGNPEKRAMLWLVVSAGSVFENDDQQGLAHFTEHMAFNGSAHFDKNSLISRLEEIGMKFGKDLNAFTAFDQTVYQITIPTEKDEYADLGLLILNDVAHELSFNQAELDAERGVIQEEWRMSLGANQRIQDDMLKAVFNGSKYANRLPIGTMDVVMNFKRETILDYYTTWYRPDNMAVVAVGDFDPIVMENKIKDVFGKLQNPATPLVRPNITVPPNKEPIVKLSSDPECPATAVEIFYKHKHQPTITVADMCEDIKAQLVSKMISARLAEKALQPNPPFIQAMGAYTEFMAGEDVFINFAALQNDKIENAIKELVCENQRVIQHGFTETELDRAKKDLLKMVEKAYNERDNQESSDLASEYMTAFLPPLTNAPGIEYECGVYKKFVPMITVEQVNTFAQNAISDENCVIFVMAPEKDGFNLPTEAQILKAFNDANQTSVEPYVDKVVDRPLIDPITAKGKVAKKEVNKQLNFETWTLSNGVKVVIKQTDFKADEITMNAESFGGYSKLPVKDVVTAKNISGVMAESGLGNYDATELQKYMNGKNVSVMPYISLYEEGFYGSCGVSDFENMLEIVNAFFTHPRFSEDAFASYLEKQKGALENQMLDPQSAWSDTLRWMLANHSEYSRPMTPEMLDEINFKNMSKIYKGRFSDPCNFTFYFVGNIDKKVAKPLVEKYLGSLETVERNETFTDLGIRPPKGAIEKEVKKGKDAKCMEMMLFHGDFGATAQEVTDLEFACEILSTRLLEEIREKESGVYTIGAYPQVSRIPNNDYIVQLFYSCDPEREPELK
ncbi:MAG: insulinase family protein, partial [Bacteroidales bacterium]|nr:insulinase family protein [Bacteroidales bacterium]